MYIKTSFFCILFFFYFALGKMCFLNLARWVYLLALAQHIPSKDLAFWSAPCHYYYFFGWKIFLYKFCTFYISHLISSSFLSESKNLIKNLNLIAFIKTHLGTLFLKGLKSLLGFCIQMFSFNKKEVKFLRSIQLT